MGFRQAHVFIEVEHLHLGPIDIGLKQRFQRIELLAPVERMILASPFSLIAACKRSTIFLAAFFPALAGYRQ